MSNIQEVDVGEVRDDLSLIPESLIYKYKPLVIVSKENIILWSGNRIEFHNCPIIETGYYDELVLKVRDVDLYRVDNTKILDEVQVVNFQEVFDKYQYYTQVLIPMERKREDYTGVLSSKIIKNFKKVQDALFQTLII